MALERGEGAAGLNSAAEDVVKTGDGDDAGEGDDMDGLLFRWKDC